MSIDCSPRHVLQQAIAQHKEAIERLEIVLQERKEAVQFALFLALDTREELRAELEELHDAFEALHALKRAERMERKLA